MEPCLRPFLEWILARHAAHGGATEIRILTSGRGVWSTLAGPSDLDGLLNQLRPGTAGPQPRIGEANVYFSMQPIRRSTSGPARLQRVARAPRDRDAVAYSLFVVDIDPERSPRGRSATDAEKAQARIVADRVRSWLSEQGVDSLLGDSGNGWHLLVPLVPATGEEIRQAALDARTLLRWLDAHFSTSAAKVDRSTFNPGRVLKLYGTLAMKGAHTADTPHRWSSIDLSAIPEDIDLFGRLAALTEDAPLSLPARPPPQPRDDWRQRALAALPLAAVYGPWLTGRTSGHGWRQCRDPFAPSGDQNPSAGVADGTGQAERASFHSFRTQQTRDVFDVLVALERAPDFRQAKALVAELSGVPLPDPSPAPGRRTPPPPSQTGEPKGEGGDEALRAAIVQIVAGPRSQQRAALEGLQRTTGVDRGRMRTLVRQARLAQRSNKRRAEATHRGRVVVDHTTNRDTVDGLFTHLIEAIAPFERLFCHEQQLVFVRRGVGPIPVTEGNLPGLLCALLELRQLRVTDEGPQFVRYALLARELARAFVHSPRVAGRLPPLVQYTRAPLFDRDWRFVAKPGYHPDAGMFYDGPPIEVRVGRRALDVALADFHFKGEADRVNFVGALLTALTMPHWGRGHPFLAINGNKPGVGKSTLARVLCAITEGSEPRTVSYTDDDAELEKQLATRISAGDRIVVLDNVKTRRPIDSAVLERCITDTRLNFRRLGGNTAITRPQNDVLFCLTMNLVQLGPDLRRRALPLNLELDADVQRTTYPKGDLVAWVLEHRLALIGELAAMVTAWLEAGRPIPEAPARHSTSQPWAQTIDAILRHAGLSGFLTNIEDSVDPKHALLSAIARTQHHRGLLRPSEWVDHLEALLAERFHDRGGQPRTDRAKATIVGTLFCDALGSRFPVADGRVELVRAWPEGTRRSPAYGFRPIPS